MNKTTGYKTGRILTENKYIKRVINNYNFALIL